jgi:hypothetical protein
VGLVAAGGSPEAVMMKFTPLAKVATSYVFERGRKGGRERRGKERREREKERGREGTRERREEMQYS